MIRLTIASLLLALGLAACDGDRGREGRRGDRGSWGEQRVKDWRVLVEPTAVEMGSVARELVTHGTIESEAMADITPEAGGVVREIRVEEGDAVQRGAVLAVLANPSLEAGSARARVELSQAQRRFDQSRTLHQRGAISDSEFQEAQDAFAIAQASHREATGSAGFTRLTSPIDGTVAVRDIRVGELAGGAQRAFQVVDLDRLRVIVNLSEGDLQALHVGQPVVLTGSYNRDASTTGEILRISPVVDEASGTVRVTIAVHNNVEGAPVLRPGQFVEVRIEVDRHADVMTIPRRAVYWQDGAPVAWRIVAKPETDDEERDDAGDGERRKWGNGSRDSDDSSWFAGWFSDDEDTEEEQSDPWEGVPRRIVERVSLTIGYTDSVRAEVVAGLAAEDLVVAVGGENLRPDAEVKLPGDPNPQREKPPQSGAEPDDQDGEDE